LTQMFTSSLAKTQPEAVLRHRRFVTNAQAWSTPRDLIQREQARPTFWEMQELQATVEKMAGKAELTRADVCDLCDRLSCEGVEDLGRSLTRPDVFGSLIAPDERSVGGSRSNSKSRSVSKEAPATAPFSARTATGALGGGNDGSGGKRHPLESLVNPDATMATKDVVKYLVTLDWHRHDATTLGRRIEKLYNDARKADLAGNKKEQSLCQTAALRLEGAKDRHLDSKMAATGELLLGSARKPRADTFYQTLCRPLREMDEQTGRGCLRVSLQERSTSLGG